MSHTSDSVTVITSVIVLFRLPGWAFCIPTPSPTKITFTYNSVLTVIPVSFCTAYIFVTFRVRVRVSFRVRV